MLPLLLLQSALAAPPPRYHAILMAHDDLPMETTPDGVPIDDEAGNHQYFFPRSGPDRDLVRERIPPEELVPTGRAPCSQQTPFTLCAVTRDQERVEEFLLLYADPFLVNTLRPGLTGPPIPATRDTPTQRAATLEQAQEAFAETRCHIGLMRGELRSGCEGMSLPPHLAEQSTRHAEDIVFVHFSGHGVPGGMVLRNELLDPDTFEQWVQSLGADLVVVMVDACHGAGLTDREPGTIPARKDETRVFQPRLYRRGPLEAPRDVALFNAAVHYQLVELGELRSGMLTHLILSGLMGGADEDGDRRVTFAELSSFFEVNTTGAGEFDGRTAAPAGNRDRVLLDLTRNREAVSVLEVDRGLGGRLVVADPEGAVAELNVDGRRLGSARQVRLSLPGPVHDLYFLDLKPKTGRQVRVAPSWDLTQDPGFLRSFEGQPAAEDDAVAAYLLRTQRQRRMFTSRRLPVTEWRPGPHLSLQARAGYHWTEAYGRIEEGEWNDERYAEGENSDKIHELYNISPHAWNLATAGLVVQAHGLWFGMAELRGGLSLGPRTVVQTHEGSTVFLGRLSGGLGLSSFLGNPAILASVSGGKSINQALFPDRGQALQSQDVTLSADFARASPSVMAGNYYLAGSLRLDLARLRPAIVEVVRLHDVQTVATERSEDGQITRREDRPYDAWQLTLGFEIGRLPR